MNNRHLILLYQSIYFFIIIACFSFYISCSGTRLVATWKDTSYNQTPFKKIAVIGIFRRLENRKDYEDSIVRLLKEKGTDAINGLSLLSPDKEYKYEEMENIFDSQKIDGILILRMKSVDRKDKYIPPVEDVVPEEPNVIYFNNYMKFYRVIQEPGYLQETDIFHLECNLYRNDNDRLIWTTEARTIEPDVTSDEPIYSADASAELARLLVSELKKNNLIK